MQEKEPQRRHHICLMNVTRAIISLGNIRVVTMVKVLRVAAYRQAAYATEIGSRGICDGAKHISFADEAHQPRQLGSVVSVFLQDILLY